MSKSKGNTVEADPLIEKYGADVVRGFILFAAPPEKELEWNDKGIEGLHRFLGRVERFVETSIPVIKKTGQIEPKLLSKELKEFYVSINKTVKRVTEDVEKDFHFNTALAALMEFTNYLYLFKVPEGEEKAFPPLLKLAVEDLVLLLAPFTPHITEELWEKLGYKESIFLHSLPKCDLEYISGEEAVIVLQVNGKLRGRLTVSLDIEDEKVKELALKDEKIIAFLSGKTVKKVVVVKNKLVNIVAV